MKIGWVILLVMGLALAASLAGNAYFWHERDGLLQREATVKQLQADTAAAAKACGASVDKLAMAGVDRDDRLEAALKAVAPKVRAENMAALKALQAKPDDPKDPCGSARRFIQREVGAERNIP